MCQRTLEALTLQSQLDRQRLRVPNPNRQHFLAIGDLEQNNRVLAVIPHQPTDLYFEKVDQFIEEYGLEEINADILSVRKELVGFTPIEVAV